MNIATKISSLALFLMDYWDRPDVFVSAMKEFGVDRDMLAVLGNPGMLPMKVSGVLSKHIDHQNIVT